MFADYVHELIKHLKRKYPDKEYLMIADNLSSHQTSTIMKVYQEPRLKVLFTAPSTPEFSPKVVHSLLVSLERNSPGTQSRLLAVMRALLVKTPRSGKFQSGLTRRVRADDAFGVVGGDIVR